MRRRRLAPSAAEAVALEDDHFVEHRVPVEQSRACGREQPGDVRLRKPPPQQREDRQRVHDVADGAGFDQQNAARRGWKLDQLHYRGSRWSSVVATPASRSALSTFCC